METRVNQTRALVLCKPKKPQAVDIQRQMAASGVRIISQGQDLFPGFNGTSPPLSTLIADAADLDILFEVDRRAQMPPETLESVLRFGVDRARALGNELKSVTVSWKPGQLIVSPRTWAGDETAERELRSLLSDQEELHFLDRVSQIVAQESTLPHILREISDHLARFFPRAQNGCKADSITIMLYDTLTEALSTHVIWTPQGIREVEYLSAPDDAGIAAKTFYSDEDALFVENGGESLIGTVIKSDERRMGIIVISSLKENAFTEKDLRILESVSGRLGPAFQRISRHLEESYLDTKFGFPPFGLKVYNPKYLMAKLNVGIQTARSQRAPFSVIYVDIDHFKALNEVSVHADVDYVLAEVFSRIIKSLRGDRVCRHGGEEIAIPLQIPIAQAMAVADRIHKAVGSTNMIVRIPYPDESRAEQMLAQIKARALQYHDHGIASASVERGRGGNTILVLTVRKTLSVGIAEYASSDTPESLLRKADKAQQQAKAGGRNKVVAYSE